jgi:cbb3-type cytochrome oxidase cytochrome c subunit
MTKLIVIFLLATINNNFSDKWSSIIVIGHRDHLIRRQAVVNELYIPFYPFRQEDSI